MKKPIFNILIIALFIGIFFLQLGGYFIHNYFSNKSISSFEEKEYKQAMTKLSGLRARESDKLVKDMNGKYSPAVYNRIQKKWEWMKRVEWDVLFTYNVGYLEKEIIGVGQIWAISKTPSNLEYELKTSLTSLEPTWVPVFIYDTGYQHIIVEDDLMDLLHSSGAIALLLFVLSIFYRGKEDTFKIKRKHLFFLVFSVFITVYVPKLLWIFITYGFPDINYPVLSIAVMKGATIAGYLRMTYLLKFLGLMGVGASYYLFSQKFYKKRLMVSIVIGIIAILLPWSILVSPTVGLLGSLSILVVGAHPVQYNMEYVGVLSLATVSWIVFCFMFKCIIYTKKDYTRWENHFSDD